MNIYIINIRKRLDDILFTDLLKLIDVNYQQKILRYRFWEDRQRSLYGHLLSRYAIIKKWNLKNNEINIGQNNYGKPYILNYENMHYNVSHSGEWVACVVNTSVVGIDLQEIQENKWNIAEHFFSQEENKYLCSLEQEQRLYAFYDIWSLKEAYIKAIGKGLYQSLDEFSIIKEDDRFWLYINGKKSENLYFKQYDIGEMYRFSVCSGENNFCDEIQELTLYKIMELVK